MILLAAENVEQALNWNLILAGMNIVISAAITVGLFYVGRKTNEVNKVKDKLETAAKEAVDLRFANLSHELYRSIERLTAAVVTIEKRLDSGDNEFADQRRTDHRLELKTQQTIADLRDHCATKEDLKVLNDRISKIEIGVTRLTASVKCLRDSDCENRPGN